MNKGRNLERTSLFIRTEQLEELRRIAEQTGAPIGFMVRQAIDSYLNERHLRSARPECGEITDERSSATP